MRYAPYPSEARAVPSMSDGELLDYFLLRVFETEEVWMLKNGDAPLLRESGGQLRLPLWPYRQFADEALAALGKPAEAVAQSLEFFLEDTLLWLIDDDIGIEIMPRLQSPGCLITPHRVLSVIEGMIDAGDYHMDS